MRDGDKPAGVVGRGVAAMVDIAGVLILVICYFSVVAARLLSPRSEFCLQQPDAIFTVAGFIVVSVLYRHAGRCPIAHPDPC